MRRAMRRSRRSRRSRPSPGTPFFAGRRGQLVWLVVMLALTLASSVLGLVQSGRRKIPAPVSSAQRPRTVNSPAPNGNRPVSPQQTPAPAATPASGLPPSATPSATPTPAANPAATPTGATAPPASDDSDAVDEGDVVRVSSNLVPVPASVIDAQGRAVTNLQLKDFELRVDGQLKPISDLTHAETPVRMAVLFDNSASLTAARAFEKQAAVRFFRRVIRPVDQAALYSISTEPTLIRPLTNDVPALVRAVEHFPNPEGATSLFDAIAQAAEYLRPHTGRKVIVIVSDGVETTSMLDFDETLRRMLAADCQFFAVQTGHSDNPNLRDLVAERRLQEFASQTGGAVYAPKDTSDLDHAFSQVAADLAQQYVLSYYPPEDLRDGRFHLFSLKVTTRGDVRVRTRKGYYAPKG